MYITSLSLHHFRNFEDVEKVEFPGEALLVAAAPNATGEDKFSGKYGDVAAREVISGEYRGVCSVG